MSDLHYSLNYRDYTVHNALFWGNFKGHCALVMEGTWGHRAVHAGIAFIQLWPIISQIASLFEMLIVKSCLFNALVDKKALQKNLKKVKKIEPSTTEESIKAEKLEAVKEESQKFVMSLTRDQLPKVVGEDEDPGAPTSGGSSPDSSLSNISSDSETPVSLEVTAELQLVKAKQDKEDTCLII